LERSLRVPARRECGAWLLVYGLGFGVWRFWEQGFVAWRPDRWWSAVGRLRWVGTRSCLGGRECSRLFQPGSRSHGCTCGCYQSVSRASIPPHKLPGLFFLQQKTMCARLDRCQLEGRCTPRMRMMSGFSRGRAACTHAVCARKHGGARRASPLGGDDQSAAGAGAPVPAGGREE
jgi:hypothetical protein